MITPLLNYVIISILVVEHIQLTGCSVKEVKNFKTNRA